MKKIKQSFKNVREILNIYDENLSGYAASLSFHTILSLLPILMLSLSIFTQMPSFEKYYERIKQFIFSNLLPTNQDTFANYIEQFLQNSVSLGITGLVAVVFTSIMFFLDFENIISKITGAEKRGFFRSLSSYWTLITLAPLGLGLSFYISGILQNLLDSNDFTKWINLLSIFPYIIVWAIFAVVYSISINLETKTRNIILSSFIASIFWNISKILFVQYALYSKTYLSIYGSFSVLLFFFVWIYISWIIFLYGVKVCVFLDKKDRQNTENSTQNSKKTVTNA